MDGDTGTGRLDVDVGMDVGTGTGRLDVDVGMDGDTGLSRVNENGSSYLNVVIYFYDCFLFAFNCRFYLNILVNAGMFFNKLRYEMFFFYKFFHY